MPAIKNRDDAADRPYLHKSRSVKSRGNVHVTGAGGLINVNDFRALYKSDPTERIKLVRFGILPSDVKSIAERMQVQQKKFMQSLGLSVATINRKNSTQTPLSRDESERVMGVAKLIGQLETIFQESGDEEVKDFDCAQWMAEWLDEPNAALGGQKPIEYMDTSEGRTLISNLVGRFQSGAYS